MAAASAVQPLRPPCEMHQEEGNAQAITLSQIIVQIAVRLLFITGSILLTAALFPASFHAVVIPAVAIGVTVLASFFYLQPTRVPPLREVAPSPLIEPIAPRSVESPPLEEPDRDAPPRLRNTGDNCAFNALVHFFKSDPWIAAWFRDLPADNANMAAFERFLADYRLPPRLVTAFREHVNRQGEPRSPVTQMFKSFIDGHIPDPAYSAEFERMKPIYNNLRLLQVPFANFFAAYDEAMANNQTVGTSQELRGAVHRIAPSIPNEGVQVDASEVMNHILNLLPPAQKMSILERTVYDTEGRPPLAGNPDGITEVEEAPGYLTLSLPKDKTAHTLEELLRRYCDDRTVLHRNNVNYPVHIEREFQEAPNTLRFLINRFDFITPQRGWMAGLMQYFGSSPGDGRVKRDDPVEAPDVLTLTVTSATGERSQRRYQLVSYINHEGVEMDSGHYTAGRRINGRDYFMSDEAVTLVDPEARGAARQRAYLLCYVLVPE